MGFTQISMQCLKEIDGKAKISNTEKIHSEKWTSGGRIWITKVQSDLLLRSNRNIMFQLSAIFGFLGFNHKRKRVSLFQKLFLAVQKTFFSNSGNKKNGYF